MATASQALKDKNLQKYLDELQETKREIDRKLVQEQGKADEQRNNNNFSGEQPLLAVPQQVQQEDEFIDASEALKPTGKFFEQSSVVELTQKPKEKEIIIEESNKPASGTESNLRK